MVRLAHTFRLVDIDTAGMIGLKFNFDRDLQKAIKPIPGVTWSRNYGWVGPIEMAETIGDIATTHGYKVIDELIDRIGETKLPEARSDLYPYQRIGAHRGVEEGALLLEYVPGAGKTVTALEAVTLAGCRSILVVCPALARLVWADEIIKWGYQYRVDLIETGKQASVLVPKKDRRAVVVSYELAAKLPIRVDFDGIICDEFHFLKVGTSGRSMTVTEIVDRCMPKILLGLTGTAITNQPQDLWAQLDLLYPERFGTLGKFKRRYCNAIPNEYAQSKFTYEGLNKEYAGELRDRLKWVSHQITDEDISDLVPPLTTAIIRIKPKRGAKKNRDLLQYFDAHRIHTNKFEAHLMRESATRIKAAGQWVMNARSEADHLLIFAYFKSTVHEITKMLDAGDIPIYWITGELSHAKRRAKIKEAAAQPRSITVATIDSVGIAIDMTANTRGLFAELYSTPGPITQALKRAHRLVSKTRVHFDFLAVQGTYDDIIVRALGEKYRNKALLMKTNKLDLDVAASLAELKETEAAWCARMKEIAESYVEEEY